MSSRIVVIVIVGASVDCDLGGLNDSPTRSGGVGRSRDIHTYNIAIMWFSCRRALPMVLLFLTGGAIINVAVAWSLTRWSDLKVRQLHSPFAEAVARNRFVIHDPDMAWPVQVPGDWKRPNSAITTSGFGAAVWAGSGFEVTDRTANGWSLEVFRFGWPCVSMQWKIARTMEDKDDGSRNWQAYLDSPPGCIDLKHLLPPRGDSLDRAIHVHERLPLLPIWPGFAINTIFYAAMILGLWLLLVAPGRVRRRIRIKRAQCPACGYPIRGRTSDVCTECGVVLRERC